MISLTNVAKIAAAERLDDLNSEAVDYQPLIGEVIAVMWLKGGTYLYQLNTSVVLPACDYCCRWCVRSLK